MVKTKSAIIYKQVSLWSGIYLFVYLTTHFLNHALGLISVELMDQGREIFDAVWRNPVTTYLVLIALTVHTLIVLGKLYSMKTYKGLPGMFYVQAITGLSVPLFIIPHLFDTKYIYEVYDIQITYLIELYLVDQATMITMVICSVYIWLHGWVGLKNYLFLKPWFTRYQGMFTAGVTLLPALALGGVLSAYKEIDYLKASQPELFSLIHDSKKSGIDLNVLSKELDNLSNQASGIYLLIIILLFSMRTLRNQMRKAKGSIEISYSTGNQCRVMAGTSLLEASLQSAIPHAHVCGGRGRCSTCRVKVLEGGESLEPPSDLEEKVLRRIHAGSSVRLACQSYPKKDIRIAPLLPAEATVKDAMEQAKYMQGSELKLAILFADIRGFTSFSEKKLPFDLVFILNQYFAAMGKAIEENGGYLDKFIGDGTMALFGLDTDYAEGCKNAIKAAVAMQSNLDELNRNNKIELPKPLKMGIGIHLGDVIAGKMGYKHTSHLTAIGDAVNAASRLESSTKELEAQLVISEAAAEASGVDFSAQRRCELQVKGKKESIKVYSIAQLARLETK